MQHRRQPHLVIGLDEEEEASDDKQDKTSDSPDVGLLGHVMSDTAIDGTIDKDEFVEIIASLMIR